jgi:amino acid adenylation domain-containing protein
MAATQIDNTKCSDDSVLSKAKRELLQQYLRGQRGKSDEASLVRRLRPAEATPLSFSQQQVWLHDQMTGDIPFYNETVTIYRQGPMDTAVLEKCLWEIIRRHEIWRTTFAASAGEPAQVVHSNSVGFRLVVEDLRRLPENERVAEAVRLATDDARKPFDLKTGPLVRALLITIDDEQHRLYMAIHQVVFDAVTAYRALLPELTSLYDAFAAGKPTPLQEPRLQYGDFAEWQREMRQTESWSGHLAYWSTQLSGDLPVLQWPNDRRRPAIESHRGAIERFRLSSSLVQQLNTLSPQQGVSVYMTLVAGLATLLHRYTSQDDILVGSFTAGRKWAQLEMLPGYFVNPLALRINLSGNPTFRELQARVRNVVLDALAHEEAPFIEVVREIRYRPDPSRNPLFQVALSQQPKLPALPPGWDLATEEICNGGSKLDLMIVVDNRDDSIFGPITYNPDLFDRGTIQKMVGHWQTLLESAIAGPEQRIADLPLLTAGEREQILVEWNNTRTSCPQNTCLHELIEAQVERTPDAIAATFEQERISYRDLNARANQLARHLRKLGVGPEVLVGVCMDRSLDMIVALLGIMKAGGAYVPIDPAYPKARLEFMIADSGLRFIICDNASRSSVPEFAERLICVDQYWPTILRESKQDLSSDVRPENLVYVIYTSGSTGRPKGVQISHGALANLVKSIQRRPGIDQDDRLLAVTTISFDIAALELYVPLTAGACCVIAGRDAAADGYQLWKMLEDSKITSMQATPSTWKLLLESGWTGKTNLKILCGGEAMPQELAVQLLTRGSSVWNMYGPTETTVWSALHRTASDKEPVLIGRPIDNTEIYVLDRKLQLLPSGTTGELYIGGDGLARGYLNRPELEAEKFIPNPFSKRPGARLYSTGDLARYRDDGNIECLGRLDNQVKMRGFRIELGEIESVLRAHPAITDACAIVREDIPGDLRLVAYLRLVEEETSTLTDIHGFLKERLPGYMVPSLVALDSFPLTPNGKLDRLALPRPDVPQTSQRHLDELPQDPIEELLAAIWKDLLRVQHISAYDNFFDLGGHSLLATQVVSRLEKETGLRIKPKELAFQTLGQFAASCKERLKRQ